MEPMLDNPAWWALNSHHASFAEGSDLAKRYRQGIVPFIALSSPKKKVAEDLDPRMQSGESFYVIGELPLLPSNWTMEFELPCVQMMAPDRIAPIIEDTAEGDGPELILLNEEDKEEMFALINYLQPGYYELNTRQMGVYYGIRHEGRLVAMAGERLRLQGFSEISAVCTHPDFAGRKYAQRLMIALCRRQRDAGIQPFLHTAKSNIRAIRLYEHMGFTHRRDIAFWRIRKNI